MALVEREWSVKGKLKSLCLSHGWSYGVLWRFDPRNHMLLTMENAHYEEHAGDVVENMLLQVHMLGEGLIGRAAVDGNHRWISMNSPSTQQHTASDYSEVLPQFSSGIKTIVVIPLELRGVLQFGSTKETLETTEFLDQARKSLLKNGISSSPYCNSASLNSGVAGENGLLSLVNSSLNSWPDTLGNMGSFSMFDSVPFPCEYDGRDGRADDGLIIDPGFASFPKDSEGRPSDSVNMPASFIDACRMDELSQWLGNPSRLSSPSLDPVLTGSISNTFGVDLIPSQQLGNECSVRSSLSNTFNSSAEGKPLMEAANSELLPDFGMDFGFDQLGEYLEDVINPITVKSSPLPIGTDVSVSECISDLKGSSASAQKKGLFSELGLESLLRDGSSTSSITKSCLDDQWPASKKRRTEVCQTMDGQSYSWEPQLVQSTIKGEQSQDLDSLKECMEKPKTGLWFDENCNMDAKSCISSVSAPTRKPEEPAKPTKKKARPGESTRPRPKDRQMIADRIKELRDLIPSGSKLSIDSLLGRTVKHMIFLQNLTKHADKLKRVDEPKLIGKNGSLVQKDSSTSSSPSNRGATWAYEVGGSNLFCPIIVEDLSQPGQMLIEMLCEERGYFLEIADVVRSFGLTILKGVMEVRDDKIWAHYIVEGNRHVTRMDVFVSLMQLLQGTSTSEEKVTSDPIPDPFVNNGVPPLWNSYQQHAVLLPI